MAGLSDAKVRAVKATGKAFKLSDGQQLYLHVSATGGRSWRMNYQIGRGTSGKPVQKTLTIGAYPAITLAQAREARDAAKALLARGIEPKPADLFERTGPAPDDRPDFESVALAWLKLQAKRWSKTHAQDVLERMKADVFPAIGAAKLADLKASDIHRVLQEVVDRGAIETAHRLRQRISAVFVYGIAFEMVENDPAQNLSLALPRKPKVRKQPAITSLAGLQQLLVDCEAERCRAPTKDRKSTV